MILTSAPAPAPTPFCKDREDGASLGFQYQADEGRGKQTGMDGDVKEGAERYWGEERREVLAWSVADT